MYDERGSMKQLRRENIVPSLVKNVDILSTHPGYRYNYFQSFEELDDYFKKECGEDWRSQEWAKFWISDYRSFERSLTIKENRQKLAQPETVNTARSDRANFILLAIKQFRDVENKSLRDIAKFLLDEYDIKIHHVNLWRLLERNGITLSRRKGYKKINKEQGNGSSE